MNDLKNTVTLSAEAAALLKEIDATCGDVLRRLGMLEADYINNKAVLLEELRSRRAQFKSFMDDSLRKAGVDITKERWNLDGDTMTLHRAN